MQLEFPQWWLDLLLQLFHRLLQGSPHSYSFSTCSNNYFRLWQHSSPFLNNCPKWVLEWYSKLNMCEHIYRHVNLDNQKPNLGSWLECHQSKNIPTIIVMKTFCNTFENQSIYLIIGLSQTNPISIGVKPIVTQ